MIARWHLTVAKLSLSAWFPFARSLRRLKRQIFGYRPDQSNIGSTFEDLARLYQLMCEHRQYFRGTVLEIGSGWFPIAGIIMRLLGAERVILTDVTPNMDQGTFTTARQVILDRLDEVVRLFDLDANAARATLSHGTTYDALGLVYNAPFDIAAVADGSVDIVMSRACLEHIPSADLRSLMSALRPKLRSGGIMAHAIDHGDHLAYADRSLSRLNFLTWTERQHRLSWWLLRGGENRLRYREFEELFREAGFEVVASQGLVHEPTLRQVPGLALTPPYDSMTAEDLAILTSWFVLRPAGPRTE